jgi:hypothetical protein
MLWSAGLLEHEEQRLGLQTRARAVGMVGGMVVGDDELAAAKNGEVQNPVPWPFVRRKSSYLQDVLALWLIHH